MCNAVKCEEIKAAKSDGEDFEDLAGVPKDMPLLDIPAIAMDVALALEYLHNAGFAHRDIKKQQRVTHVVSRLGTRSSEDV